MQCIAIAIYAFNKFTSPLSKMHSGDELIILFCLKYIILKKKVEKFLFLIFIVTVCKNNHHYNNHQKTHIQSCFSISYDIILLTL